MNPALNFMMTTRAGRLGGALLLGVALAVAQPPLFAWPVAFLAAPALAVLAVGASTRMAFGVGWSAGTGFFLAGLHWIAEAFFVDAARHGWMAPFAILLMAAGLGLFWGAAFWAARRTGARGVWAALALAAAWTLAEMARSYVLTGFPWALPGYVLASTPVAQTAAVAGPHMLGFGLLALTLLPAAPLLSPGPPRHPLRWAAACWAFAAVALAGAWMWGAARQTDAPGERGTVVRVVQPNAPQREKWRRERIPVFFERLRRLSRPAEGERPPDVVIWPETAVPFLLERDENARRLIAESARGAPVLLGVRRTPMGPDGPEWRNGLAVLSPLGEIVATYDKQHLVPFGEYLPLHGLLSRLGLSALVGEDGGFAPGPGPRTLRTDGLPPFAPQICYETIFPHEMPPLSDRPDWIVQVTNDAWFGESAGPWQHLHQARMRAIEQGLPVVRAANTGISAIIDARGQVTASLGLQRDGVVQGRLPRPLPPTLYARSGDAPGAAFALVVFLAAWGFGRLAAAARARASA